MSSIHKKAGDLLPSRLTRENLLEAVTHDPAVLCLRIIDREDEPYLRDLCAAIEQATLREDEIIRNEGLCSYYQEAVQRYGSVEELCNAELLNYEDVYDYTIYPYCEEYIKGFLGEDDGELNEYTDMTEAYLQGEEDAEKLRSLIKT